MRGTTKPLASGDVSLRNGKTAALTLAALSLVTAAAVAPLQGTAVIISALIGVTLYSPLAKRAPVAKGIATAILCCSPFLYASALTGTHFPVIYYVLLCVFIVGRELLLDVRDYSWDRSLNIQTVVAYLGTRASKIAGWSFMAIGLLGFVLSAHGLSFWMFVVAAGSLLPLIALYQKNQQQALGLSRVTLLLATLAVVV